MPEYFVQVTRVLHLAIDADSPAEALDKASDVAWSWLPEQAAAGQQGQVRLAMSRTHGVEPRTTEHPASAS